MLQHTSSKSFKGFSSCNRFYPHPFPHPPICKHDVFEQSSIMLRMVAVLHYFVTYEKPLSFIGDKPSHQLLQSFFKQQYSHSSCFLVKTRYFLASASLIPVSTCCIQFLRLDRQNSFSLNNHQRERFGNGRRLSRH